MFGEFTSEVIWTWSFLCGKILNNNQKNLIEIGLLRLPMSSWVSFDSLHFLRNVSFYLNCYIYWHKVIHIFSYYPFNINRICTDDISLICHTGNLCLLEVYQFYWFSQRSIFPPLIFSVVFWFSILLISILIFISSFDLLRVSFAVIFLILKVEAKIIVLRLIL